MRLVRLRKFALLFAACGVAAAGLATPAFAGGGYGYGYRPHAGVHVAHRRGYFPRGYYRGRGYYAPRRFYPPRRYYGPRRRYHRGGYYRYRRHRGGGADAALIALGAIGGAIIIGEIIEEDRRRDAARERAYARALERERRRRRAYDPRYDEYYYRRGESQPPDGRGRYAYPDDDVYADDFGDDGEPWYDDRRDPEPDFAPPPPRQDPRRPPGAAPRAEDRAPVERGSEDPPAFEEPPAAPPPRRRPAPEPGFEGPEFEPGFEPELAPEPQIREPDPPRGPGRAPRPAPSTPVERDDLGETFDDDLEDELLGGPDDREILKREEREENEEDRRDERENARGEIITIAVDAAFRDCALEAREAARREGAILAMPARPSRVEAVGPDLVRMTAELTASDARGRNAVRRLTCEANVDRITFVELS